MKTASTAVRNCIIVLFLTAMVAVAEISGIHEMVFPEAAALCVGLWLLPKAVWNVRWWQIPLLLTTAAIIGLATNHLLPCSFEVRFALAFIVVISLLRLVRCNMYPVVSAAMLPVLIDTRSWAYPLSVLVLSLLLAGGRVLLRQEGRSEYSPFTLLQLVLLAIALCIPLAVSSILHLSILNYALVPPLVVTMIEFAGRKSGFRKRPWSIWGLIVAAATLGAYLQWLVHLTWGLPSAVGAFVALSLMLLLFHHFKPFAPALAICLVPILLHDEALPFFPLLVALGSAWFIVAGELVARWSERKKMGQ